MTRLEQPFVTLKKRKSLTPNGTEEELPGNQKFEVLMEKTLQSSKISSLGILH